MLCLPVRVRIQVGPPYLFLRVFQYFAPISTRRSALGFGQGYTLSLERPKTKRTLRLTALIGGWENWLRMAKVQVSKIEAARRQLTTAINLYFKNGDAVSIHTLAASSAKYKGKTESR